jgi:hypothetical protein
MRIGSALRKHARRTPALRRSSGLRHVLVAIALAWLACIAMPAQARRMSVHADEVNAAAGNFRDVHVELEWPADAPQGQLHLRARQRSR